MKKLILLSLIIVLSVIACLGIKGDVLQLFESKVLSQSGIQADDNYSKYQQLIQDNKLNENGIFSDEIIDDMDPNNLELSTTETNGKILVTFAANSRANVYYYLDSTFTQPIKDSCYLNPGDNIYVKQIQYKDNYSLMYSLKEFEVYGFNIDGQRGKMIGEVPVSENLVITIPEDYEGSNVSVVPVGEMKKVSISLNDNYIDSNNEMHNLSGVWYIDGLPTQEDLVEVGTVNQYLIEYSYDDSEYYVAESTPKAFKDKDGLVEFELSVLYEDISNYSVTLIKYSDLIFNGKFNNGIEKILVNGESDLLEDNIISSLKRNDIIVVETKKDYVINNRKLILEAEEKLKDGNNKYTFRVPEDTVLTEFELGVADKTGNYEYAFINNGSTELRYSKTNGQEIISEGETVAEKEEVIVTITPDIGHYITGPGVKNNKLTKTMTFGEYLKQIDKIIEQHEIKKLINLSLDRSSDYGICIFKVDGKVTEKNSLVLKHDQVLSIEFELTNSEYEIVRSDANLVESVANLVSGILSNNKITVTIPISESLSGTTISGDDYIEIRKKGSE